MTTEILETYDLERNYLGDQERESFYSEIKEEYKKSKKIFRQVKSIRLLFMNSDGRVYLQKRSKIKNENPGLYDKSVGGHVNKGQSMELTAIRECAEELGFPAAILSTEEFNEAVKLTDLNVVGIFKKVDEVNNFESTRISKDGSAFIQPYISAFFVGYFDGPIKFSDGESSGIEVMSINELKEELKNKPEKFTKDLEFMINEYGKYLKPIS